MNPSQSAFFCRTKNVSTWIQKYSYKPASHHFGKILSPSGVLPDDFLLQPWMVALMRKLPTVAASRILASGLCLLIAGCQTPMFSDGLFSSLSPKKTLTTQKSPSTNQNISATKPRIGGRGWRNASPRKAQQETQAQVAKLNNVGRLREFLAKGNDAMQKGLYDDARIQYETVLSIEPHHATAHHMLGRISDMSKNFGEAERHYLAALGANREDGYLLSDLGYSYLQQGRLDEAKQYLTQAITREPDLAIAKVNLAAVYAHGGDQRGALAWLRQVGTEEQAQETLASIVSKPAPWVLNGSAEALANSADDYTINNDGKVLDANGQPLTTFAEVQQAMEAIRQKQQRARLAEKQREEFLLDRQMQNALAEQRGSANRNSRLSNDANLNQQMRAIEQTSGTGQRRNLNSRPIYVGPPAQGNNQAQANGQAQGSTQQFPSGQVAGQQDPYAHLLNPAGPTSVPQQTQFSNQQVPQGQPSVQGSTVPPQFPGSAYGQEQPSNAQTMSQQPQQQYADPRMTPGLQTGYQTGGNNPQAFSQPAPLQQVPQQRPQLQSAPNSAPQYVAPPNTIPRDQLGNPIQSYPPGSRGWNAQPGNAQPIQGSSAPNPNFYGQNSGWPRQLPNGGNLNGTGQPAPLNQVNQANQVQPANRLGVPQINQPIQQLGFNQQQPMARIDRGQRIPQYTEADRQAMQLGMAAGFGALSPVSSGQPQSSISNQQPVNGLGQNSRGGGIPNYNGGPQQPASVAPANSGFDYGQPPSQFSGQNQQQPNQSFPGGVPANSSRIPGQVNNLQAPVRHIHGQTIAEQVGQDPQTAQSWMQMPTSQADVTMPVAFSSSTQPTHQQSQNWQHQNDGNQPWQNETFASPTTQPGFTQPHTTNPYLRQPDNDSSQQGGDQGVSTVSW